MLANMSATASFVNELASTRVRYGRGRIAVRLRRGDGKHAMRFRATLIEVYSASIGKSFDEAQRLSIPSASIENARSEPANETLNEPACLRKDGELRATTGPS